MKRRKNILRWIAIGIAVILPILLIIHTVLLWRAGSQLEQRLTAVKQAGDPLTLAELRPADVPAAENAATYWRRADADLQDVSQELNDLFSRDSYREVRLTAEDAATIRSALDAYPNVVPLLNQGAACDRYVADLDYTALPSSFLEQLLAVAQEPRAVVRVMQAQAMLLLAEGRRDAALEQCLDIFRVARLHDRQPLIISYLVSLALRTVAADAASRVLNDGPVPDELRDRLEAELALHDGMDGFAGALRSERAFGNSYFRELHDAPAWSPVAWYFKSSHAGYLDLLAHELALGAASHCDVGDQQLTPAQIADFGWAAGQLGPALKSTREAMNRTRALLRCLRVQNQIQAGGNGVSWNELGLPPEATQDPFDGNSLRVKETETGRVIYSVGANLIDDGGDLKSNADVGVNMLMVTN